MRRAIIDTSSVILLYKIGVFEIVKANYSLVLSYSVYSELVQKGYEGADVFRRMASDPAVLMIEVSETVKSEYSNVLKSLGQGEKDSIQLFYQGCGDFIILDDKKGAAYCKKSEIPYINAILMVRILFESKILGQSEYEEAFENLSRIGRYSIKILNFARTCDPSLLQRFMPVV